MGADTAAVTFNGWRSMANFALPKYHTWGSLRIRVHVADISPCCAFASEIPGILPPRTILGPERDKTPGTSPESLHRCHCASLSYDENGHRRGQPTL